MTRAGTDSVLPLTALILPGVLLLAACSRDRTTLQGETDAKQDGAAEDGRAA